MDQSPQARIVEAKLKEVCQETKSRPKKWHKRLTNRIAKFRHRCIPCLSGEAKGEVYVKTEDIITTEEKIIEVVKEDNSDCDKDELELPPIVYNPPSLQELASKVAQEHVDHLLAIQQKRARRRSGFKALYDREYGFHF